MRVERRERGERSVSDLFSHMIYEGEAIGNQNPFVTFFHQNKRGSSHGERGVKGGREGGR